MLPVRSCGTFQQGLQVVEGQKFPAAAEHAESQVDSLQWLVFYWTGAFIFLQVIGSAKPFSIFFDNLCFHSRLGDSVTTLSSGSLEMQSALTEAHARIMALEKQLSHQALEPSAHATLSRRPHISETTETWSGSTSFLELDFPLWTNVLNVWFNVVKVLLKHCTL